MTMTATVAPLAPAAGTPTGTVTFVISGKAPITAPLVAGSATATSSILNVGTHAITATYSGNANFTLSSGNDTHTVVPRAHA